MKISYNILLRAYFSTITKSHKEKIYLIYDTQHLLQTVYSLQVQEHPSQNLFGIFINPEHELVKYNDIFQTALGLRYVTGGWSCRAPPASPTSVC